ncbi:MAG: cytochrome c oxidase subunit II [Bacteroidota bacterium]
MYSEASNFVEAVDTAFVVILGISLFFLVGITATMIYLVWRYNKKRNPKASPIEGNTKLEIIWTAIPTGLVLVMFYFGWAGWKPMKETPPDAMNVKTTARMWSWSFEYENGKLSDKLVLPVNKPVVLDLVSVDVIHSLYIPSFRVKEDMVPGNEQQMWFVPQQTGTFDLFCTEYCGQRHSYMYTDVEVMEQEEFEEWYEQDADVAEEDAESGNEDATAGKNILEMTGCLACHSLDGSKIVGPSFKDLWDSERTVVTDGEERTVVADSAYIFRSVYEPDADVVEGYRKGQMISYKDQLNDDQVNKIKEYLKTLND